jgi:hypothetical protein
VYGNKAAMAELEALVRDNIQEVLEAVAAQDQADAVAATEQLQHREHGANNAQSQHPPQSRWEHCCCSYQPRQESMLSRCHALRTTATERALPACSEQVQRGMLELPSNPAASVRLLSARVRVLEEQLQAALSNNQGVFSQTGCLFTGGPH